MKKITFMRRRFAVFRCAQNVVDYVGFLEWYFLVWPNRPDLLAKITGLGHSVQEYLNSCFARLCSFNPSDVENTSPQWHAFGSWCVSLCRATFWLVEYAFPQVEHTKAIVCIVYINGLNSKCIKCFFTKSILY